jgi:hypothetical protein
MRRFVGTSLMAVSAIPFRRGVVRESFNLSTRSMIRPGSGSGYFEEAVADSKFSSEGKWREKPSSLRTLSTAEAQKLIEDGAHGDGFWFVDDELTVLGRVSARHSPQPAAI